MDYKEKYLKYKTKYTYLKYINELTNQKIYYSKYQIIGGVDNTLSKTSKPTISNGKIYYFFFGMGCDTADNYNFYNKTTKIHKKYKCDTSMAFQIQFLKFNLKPTYNIHYVNRIKNEILKDLSNNNKVLVFGHSFGGLLLNKIAEKLNSNNNFNKNNLKIATFGSIYISNYNDVSNINIINYMGLNDVALRILKIKNKPNRDELIEILEYDDKCICTYKSEPTISTTIIWINFCKNNMGVYKNKKKTIFKKITKKIQMFGTFSEWKNHNNYSNLIGILRDYLTNNINEI